MNWLTRAKSEFNELTERVNKLGKFIKSDEYMSLPEADRMDLESQLSGMEVYQRSLLKRIERHDK